MITIIEPRVAKMNAELLYKGTRGGRSEEELGGGTRMMKVCRTGR